MNTATRIDTWSRHTVCQTVPECVALAKSIASDAVSNARFSRKHKSTGLFDNRHFAMETAIEQGCYIATVARKAEQIAGCRTKSVDAIFALADKTLAKVRAIAAR